MASNSKVEYNFLGRSGLKVSNLCLGTMTFGSAHGHPTFDSPTQADEKTAHSIMDKYVELGGNFIDTANMYCYGQSESIIGTWLQKQQRSKIVLATKLRAKMGDGPNDLGLSRRHIVDMCEDSLKRLQTNYIDLYQSHCWDYGTPIEETLRTMEDLIRCGKIRYFGVSNVNGWMMQKVVDKVEAMGLSRVVSLQQQYNLMCRYSEQEEFQVCKMEGIGVLPWSPLKGGMLTGKHKRGEKPDAGYSRIGHVHRDESKAISSSPAWSWYAEDESYWNLIDVLTNIASSHSKTIPQVALRWLLQKDVVASVIVGATSTKQLEDNMGAGTGWSLSKEEMDQLDAASAVPLHYPYDQIHRMNGGGTRCNPFSTNCFVTNRV